MEGTWSFFRSGNHNNRNIRKIFVVMAEAKIRGPSAPSRQDWDLVRQKCTNSNKNDENFLDLDCFCQTHRNFREKFRRYFDEKDAPSTGRSIAAKHMSIQLLCELNDIQLQKTDNYPLKKKKAEEDAKKEVLNSLPSELPEGMEELLEVNIKDAEDQWIASVHIPNDVMNLSRDNYGAQIRQLRDEIQQLQSTNAEQTQQIQELQDINTVMTQQIQELQVANDKKTKRIRDLEKTTSSMFGEARLGKTLLNRKIIMLARHLISTNPHHGCNHQTVQFIKSYDLQKDHKVAYRFTGDKDIEDVITKLRKDNPENPMILVAQSLRAKRHYQDR